MRRERAIDFNITNEDVFYLLYLEVSLLACNDRQLRLFHLDAYMQLRILEKKGEQKNAGR